ncbi:MAG: hypothetical protein ACRD5R_05855 [Candidatus Acidiferrales bacterium]
MRRATTPMPQFHTGLHPSDWHAYPTPPYRGRGWTISFAKQTTQFPQGGEYSGDKFYPYKEVIISARDQLTAQRAANTIYNARNLLQGSNLFGMLSSGPQPVSPVASEANRNSPRRPGETPEFHSSPNIPLACLIAARVSQKLKFVYALARLAISMEIMSVPTIELDPTHSPNIPRSAFPEDHVRMATAITSAYSSIEELGLTIRASNQKPSRIDGAWNPVVKEELEQRLTNAGVDLAEEFYWNLRGKRTRIEMKRQPEITRVAPWAIKNVVRDGQMHVSDALAYASFLRSQIAAHSNEDKGDVRVLSVYDVSNVQFLARRLLLESLGFWRYVDAPDRLDPRSRAKRKRKSPSKQHSPTSVQTI